MNSKRFSIGLAFICGLLLYSCAIFYAPIPPVEFSVESDSSDLELSVLSMSRGSHEQREDGVIVASNTSTECDITFMVRSGTQTSQFVARTYGQQGFKAPLFGVETTYGFGGGIWLATPVSGNWSRYEISGVASSPESFVVGRFGGDISEIVPLIDIVAPRTEVQLGARWPGVVLTGRGGASVLAERFAVQGKGMDIYAPFGSTVLIEQGDGNQELRVDSNLPLHVMMQPGRAKIRWFPAGSDESHVEISIDAVSNEYGYGRLSFSSMIDK